MSKMKIGMKKSFRAASTGFREMREDSLRAEEPDEAADFKDEAVDFARVIRGADFSAAALKFSRSCL